MCGFVPVEGMARYVEIHGAAARCVLCGASLPALVPNHDFAGSERWACASCGRPDYDHEPAAVRAELATWFPERLER